MTARISLVVPVYNTRPEFLRECLDSVLDQTCGDWELCIVDDASTNPETLRVLDRYARKDSRIHVKRRTINGGIGAATNDGVSMASAPFIGFLDHDDILDRRCVRKVLIELDKDDETDVLYTDERLLQPDGTFVPAKKPDWSPERLRSQNYICHFAVYRASLLREIGGLTEDLEGSQDYDLVLRATERARRVAHIPEILYTWRTHVGSFSNSQGTRDVAFESGRRAVENQCARLGIDAMVEHGDVLGIYRVRRQLTSRPRVSIVIPTKGTESFVDGRRTVLVVNCIRSILEKSTYTDLEFVVVADDDTPESVLDELRAIDHEALTILGYDRDFNFSDKCNRGVLASSGEVVMLLNDDIEVIDSEWCETMLTLALQERVGAVGCLLFVEGLRVQHAGHVYRAGFPTHEGMGFPIGHEGPTRNILTQREVTGVTGAALMVRRDAFMEVGGLSNVFPNNFNDVDFCLKLRHAGYTNMYTPYARMYHFESITRGKSVDVTEHNEILGRWWQELHSDAYSRSAHRFSAEPTSLVSPLKGS